jgi:hypothetical protein
MNWRQKKKNGLIRPITDKQFRELAALGIEGEAQKLEERALEVELPREEVQE